MTAQDHDVRIDYTNWRGERRLRVIRPTGHIDLGSNRWHSNTQWLLEAVDCEDGKTKQFAMANIHEWKPL